MTQAIRNHLTAQDIAANYRTTVGYVRKLASRQRWRRVRVGRVVHYHLDDVAEGWPRGSNANGA